MSFPFAWNDLADQPHNVAPRRDRMRHHFKHAGSYLALAASSAVLAGPVLRSYRRIMKKMHKLPVELGSAMAVSCSPAGPRNEEVVESLKAAGVRRTQVRIPSWERSDLRGYEDFVRLLRGEGLEVVCALLQRRQDVLDPASWEGFLGDVFPAFSPLCSHFEIGHAWNRTKWGVWDYREYIALAQAALPFARKHDARIIGPAVIDFEFHLYPPTLRAVPFDKVSSLLYVDRTGAPENAQFGWTTAKKVALLSAVVSRSLGGPRKLWITEMNWPLVGTGEFSPAPGKPSVTEEEQADYLVRYAVICLTSGLVERIYWWQLVAPGYGLIDSRDGAWRRRPSYFALRQLVRFLEGSRFEGRAEDGGAQVFFFRRAGESSAVAWAPRGAVDYEFQVSPRLIVDRDGDERSAGASKIRLDGSPQYVFFR